MSEQITELETLLEELCKTQIEEYDVEARVMELLENVAISSLNDLPRLYRLEVKRLLKDNGQHEKAEQISET